MRTACRLAMLALLAVLCGCTIPFTHGFRENHDLSDREVAQLQFYTSSRILLRRSKTVQDRGLRRNELAIHSKVAVEEIDISGGTPCVAVRVEGEFIEVSFSPKHQERTLWFTTRDSKGERRYKLTHVVGFTNEGRPQPIYSKSYLVRYGDLDYRVIEPSNWDVHLMFDGDVSSDRELDSTSPHGWKLKDKRPTATDGPAAPTGKAAPPAVQPQSTGKSSGVGADSTVRAEGSADLSATP